MFRNDVRPPGCEMQGVYRYLCGQQIDETIVEWLVAYAPAKLSAKVSHQ